MKIYFFVFSIVLSSQALFSQSIKAYFTQSVDNSVSSVTDAKMSASLDDTIKKLIDESQTTLDLAVWDNGSSVIVNAINAAFLRGVQVRYITSSNALNSGLSAMNSGIPVLERNSGLSSNVMHNKFIIVDEQRILTGSMNFGNGSMFDDYNNVVIIEDPSLASTYTTEFEEMWGGNGATPNLTNSKFGPDKSNNTTHNFNVGGTTIQSYFSPTDNTTAEIVNAINSADFELEIAMFTFINNDIGDAVIAAKNRGVNVRCIIENVNYIGSEYNGLVSAGIPVFSHASTAFDFHHKYCIIDAQHLSSDPQVLTGSHNWTNSAETEYDENTLIIHDYIIAQQYMEEFYRRWAELGGASVESTYSNSTPYFYPNPCEDILTIINDSKSLHRYEIINANGTVVLEDVLNVAQKTVQLDLSPGLYFVKLIGEKFISNNKLIVH